MPPETRGVQKKHVFVTGRVQGVWFRAWTEQQAKELVLNGWVRNREDGRVEVVIAGLPPAISSMLKRLHQGPPAAKVEGVEVSDWKEAVAPGFQQKPSV